MPGRRSLRLVAFAALVALLLSAYACAMNSLPKFEAEVATDSMRAETLQSRFATTAGGRVHYVVSGQSEGGARILFIHGSPGTWSAYRGFLMDPELRREARLLALDRPGFGGTGGPAEPALAKQVEAAAAVLAAEPGEPAVVVGHSLGGPIAGRLALDRPDLVAAVVMVAPALDPGLERRRWYNVAGSLRLVQMLLPSAWIHSNRELWPLKAELAELAPRWATLERPTIVVQGLLDDLVPAANADFAERTFPAARLEVRRLPAAGHFVLWQQPELIVDAIRAARAR